MPYVAPTTAEIVKRLAARIVSRTTLTDLHPGSEFAQEVAATAKEIRRLARGLSTLKSLRVLRLMKGDDLDLFALEVLPSGVVRDPGDRSSSWVAFSRPTTTGALVIPVGTVVARQDGVSYLTIAEATILDGLDTSDPVQVLALQIGTAGDCAVGAILRVVSTAPGGIACTNTTTATGGLSREGDDAFRKRIIDHVRGLARCNRTAILARVQEAELDDGRRVKFTGGRTFPTGRPAQRTLYIDDGTGTLAASHEETPAEALIASATGTETASYTTRFPLATTPVIRKNLVALVEGTDYDVDLATGEVAWITPTTAGALYTIDPYRYWTGLVAEANRLIYGDLSDPTNFPGYVADGVSVLVRGASSVLVDIPATGAVLPGYDPDTVFAEVASRLLPFVNNREIGGALVSGQIVQVAMGVPGMFDFDLDEDWVDVYPAANQAVRTTAAQIVIAPSA